MLIKINGRYGARVGNQTVFTREGAISVYRAFVEVCYKNITVESAAVLADVEDDMRRIGSLLRSWKKLSFSPSKERR